MDLSGLENGRICEELASLLFPPWLCLHAEESTGQQRWQNHQAGRSHHLLSSWTGLTNGTKTFAVFCSANYEWHGCSDQCWEGKYKGIENPFTGHFVERNHATFLSGNPEIIAQFSNQKSHGKSWENLQKPDMSQAMPHAPHRPAVLQRCRSGDLNTGQGIRLQLGASNDVKLTRSN